MSDNDMTGKLVRWEHESGQWFTARVTGHRPGAGGGTYEGTVVDPGNYIGLSMFAPKQVLRVGQELPNLAPMLLTVIGEEVSDVG